jgi:hypothetical protein
VTDIRQPPGTGRETRKLIRVQPLLAQAITATPGTASAELSPNRCRCPGQNLRDPNGLVRPIHRLPRTVEERLATQLVVVAPIVHPTPNLPRLPHFTQRAGR